MRLLELVEVLDRRDSAGMRAVDFLDLADGAIADRLDALGAGIVRMALVAELRDDLVLPGRLGEGRISPIECASGFSQ